MTPLHAFTHARGLLRLVVGHDFHSNLMLILCHNLEQEFLELLLETCRRLAVLAAAVPCQQVALEERRDICLHLFFGNRQLECCGNQPCSPLLPLAVTQVGRNHLVNGIFVQVLGSFISNEDYLLVRAEPPADVVKASSYASVVVLGIVVLVHHGVIPPIKVFFRLYRLMYYIIAKFT